jgi:hypothetical protein
VLIRKHHQISNLGHDTDIFTQLMVVMARNQGETDLLRREFQLVEDVRSPKRFVQDTRLHGGIVIVQYIFGSDQKIDVTPRFAGQRQVAG